MNDFGAPATFWLLRTLLAGGALLFLAWIALRFTGDAARRQRLAAWTFRGAVLAGVLGLFPAWLTIPISLKEPKPVTTAVTAAPMVELESLPSEDEFVWELVSVEAIPAAGQTFEVEELAAPVPVVAEERSLLTWAIGAYALLAGLAALQLLAAFLALVRLRRSSRPASPAIEAHMRELAISQNVVPQVRVSSRIASPVCFGWLRPMILLPQSLADSAKPEELRWVLAHELDHLRRGDPGTGFWVGVARVLYFAVPWFWAVRRELRLAQEYLADAAAAAGRPADYAAFLVSLSTTPARRGTPLGAVAVRAGRTELFRRVSMLTQETKATNRVSRTWSLLTAGGVIAAAVGFSGIGFADDKKPEKKVVEVIVVDDDAPKKDGEKKAVKRDGDKKPDGPRDGDKKPAGPKDGDKRTFEFKVQDHVIGISPEEIQKVSKAVTAALEKGDVETAKDAMVKLNKLLAAQPRVIKLQSGNALAPLAPLAPPAVPGAPGLPAPPAVARVRIREVENEAVKKMEEKLASLKSALESVKDSPEAREALEKTIAEFKKKIEEARAKGEHFFKEVPAPKWVEGRMAEKEVAEAARKHAQDVESLLKDRLVELEKRFADAKDNPEAMAKLKAAQDAMRKQIEAAKGGVFGGRMEFFEGQPLGENFLFRKVAAGGEGGRLGIAIDAVPEVLVDQFDLPKGQCVIITMVREGTPAAKAGLKSNDVLMSIAGKPVPAETDAVIKLVNGLKPDEKFDVLILRKGKKETIKDVTLPAPKVKKAEASDSGKKERTTNFNSMNVNVNDGGFKIDAKNDEVTLHLTGHFDDGKPVVDKVSGSRDGVDFSTKDLSSLAKSDQAMIEQLLKNVSGGRK